MLSGGLCEIDTVVAEDGSLLNSYSQITSSSSGNSFDLFFSIMFTNKFAPEFKRIFKKSIETLIIIYIIFVAKPQKS